ncbi:acyclic terpene utilization AtuA family protein [Nocardioides terrisoli]|uniref:acyclic terpene utilization AtuA family protein n=1 Tax=Nocardioides terrisoli TaxID=3388267 RepID=UPI00287B8A1D|nr:acyclic terpene utilization AtuA family protein [Nocardioides marmorisolisilvae]
MKATLRIGNCSGFYGDRFSAAREMVEGGELDVLTGDYLAELTMFILWKARSAGRPGYAVTFLRQMEEVLSTCVERDIRIVTNAGGLDPAGLARDLSSLAGEVGIDLNVAYVTGDDLLPRLGELSAAGHTFTNLDTGVRLDSSGLAPVTANAYLGGRGIAAALDHGAQVVICPRVTDASLVVGPALWNFGWAEDDFDAIAGAIAAGHIIECGAQASGGNYARFDEVPDLVLPGFPIAEVRRDGSATITKHPGSPGQVSIGTVTAQLVYEVAGVEYPNPDAVLLLDTLHVEEEGPDRVRISGAKGLPAPSSAKVSMSCLGPHRQSVGFGITGSHVEAKAELLKKGMLATLADVSCFDDISWRLVRTDRADAPTNELALARYLVTFTAKDNKVLGRRIFDAAIGLALSSFPGFFLLEDSQRRSSQSGIHWPCLIPRAELSETVHLMDGSTLSIAQPFCGVGEPTGGRPARDPGPRRVSSYGETVRVMLGEVLAARSGDKGANANVGLWACDDAGYEWMRATLTVDAFRALMPEADELPITVTELPNLKALNFVVHGLLGDGAASVARFDSQAKGLAEYILSREVDVPLVLVPQSKDVA